MTGSMITDEVHAMSQAHSGSSDPGVSVARSGDGAAAPKRMSAGD